MSSIPEWREKKLKLAEAAMGKPAKYGVDVNIDEYNFEAEEPGKIERLTDLPQPVQEGARRVGVNPTEDLRSGSYFQYDHTVLLARALSKVHGVEIMSTTEALKKYDWMENYWWNAVPVDMDKYTARAEVQQTHGYFIRAAPGARVSTPIQACLFIGTQGLLQSVHNVIIAEEDSELNIITGCTTHPSATSGMHIGISEFYVKKNATITFTMIHGWAPGVDVRPRTAAILEEGGVFVNNYVCFRPVKSLQMYPTVYCKGRNSKARFHTLLYAEKESLVDVGNKAVLQAAGARAEITARAVARDKGDITARGQLVGEAPETKGHLDCRGLLLSPNARIHAIPELEGKVEGTDLSHEAAVGRIQEEQLYYMESRGLSEDQAVALIVRGFLDPEVPGLPEYLKAEVRRCIQLTAEKVL
jgi:Fe-S cluster assembly scaffold protein SufB